MIIACAQTPTGNFDFESFGKQLRSLSQEAHEKGAELLILPAASLGPLNLGIRGGDTLPDLVIPALTLDCLALDLACDVLIGLPGLGQTVMGEVVEEADGEPFSVAYIHDGELKLLPHWRSLMPQMPGGGVSCTQGPYLAEINGLQTLVVTSQSLPEINTVNSVDLIIHMPKGGFDCHQEMQLLLHKEHDLVSSNSTITPSYRVQFSLDEARRNHSWLVYVDSVGAAGLETHLGNSHVVSPWGMLVAHASNVHPELLYFQTVEPQNTQEMQAYADHYEIALQGIKHQNDLGLELASTLWQVLSAQLKLMVDQHSDEAKVLVLMDGSLASHLVAILACDSLGSHRVEARIGASCNRAKNEDARLLANQLGIEAHPIDLDLMAARAAELSLSIEKMINLDLLAYAESKDLVLLDNQDFLDSMLGSPETKIELDANYASSRDLFLMRAELLGAKISPLGQVHRSMLEDLARARNSLSQLISSNMMLSRWYPLFLPKYTSEDTEAEAIASLESCIQWLLNQAEPYSMQGVMSMLGHEGTEAQAASFFEKVIAALERRAATGGRGTKAIKIGSLDSIDCPAAIKLWRNGLEHGEQLPLKQVGKTTLERAERRILENVLAPFNPAEAQKTIMNAEALNELINEVKENLKFDGNFGLSDN